MEKSCHPTPKETLGSIVVSKIRKFKMISWLDLIVNTVMAKRNWTKEAAVLEIQSFSAEEIKQ